MKLDERTIAQALAATFDVPADEPSIVAGAAKIVVVLQGLQGREALVQMLGEIQRRATAKVVSDDCTWLADRLLEARSNS